MLNVTGLKRLTMFSCIFIFVLLLIYAFPLHIICKRIPVQRKFSWKFKMNFIFLFHPENCQQVFSFALRLISENTWLVLLETIQRVAFAIQHILEIFVFLFVGDGGKRKTALRKSSYLNVQLLYTSYVLSIDNPQLHPHNNVVCSC